MKLKFDVIVWDGENKDTIEHYTLEEAVCEGFVQFKGNEMTPTDESVIIRRGIGRVDSNGEDIYQGDIIIGTFQNMFNEGTYEQETWVHELSSPIIGTGTTLLEFLDSAVSIYIKDIIDENN